ncbi:MAG: metallophosphoesterase [Halovenus sp.]
MLSGHNAQPVASPARDGVDGLDGTPTIVSISDIHGLLPEARRALLTLSDHPEYDPVVESGRLRKLQWAGGDDYVLVFNGDLIDRGAHNEGVVELVERLVEQAPPGHVRVTFGNHEMGVLTPDVFNWHNWYSMTRSDRQRQSFIEAVADGHVVAAYEGYNVTYAHAGRRECYDVPEINDELVAGAELIAESIGTDADADVQKELLTAYPRVFGLDGETGRGPEAGIAWLDFEYMSSDAPRQIVGHTRQDNPIRRGNVICQNVLRNSRQREGGEAVLVETPETIAALGRGADGSVQEHVFSLPAEKSA